MKKIILIALATLVLCGCSAKRSEEQLASAYSDGYTEGYNTAYTEMGARNSNVTLCDGITAEFSGRFTATVEKLIPDYCALPGNTVAVVHFFQDMPFLLRFDEDMTDKLVEGQTYVFDFAPFTVSVTDTDSQPQIEDYMYQIRVANYRLAEENETGMQSFLPDVDFIVGD